MCLAAGESIYTSTIIYLRPNGKKRKLVGQREMCIESSQHGFLCFNFRKSIAVIVLTILQIWLFSSERKSAWISTDTTHALDMNWNQIQVLTWQQIYVLQMPSNVSTPPWCCMLCKHQHTTFDHSQKVEWPTEISKKCLIVSFGCRGPHWDAAA